MTAIASSDPTVAQLRALVAVADGLHFGRAATRLGVSQPSVSAAVSGLEARLGVVLVERSTRRVVLTPTGTEVARRARDVLGDLDRLIEAADTGGRRFSGVLRIGLIPTVAPYVLPSLLRLVGRRYPALRLEVTEAQTAHLAEDLAAGSLDLVALALPADLPGTVELPLYDEDFVLLVAAGHRLDGAVDVDPVELAELDVLLLDEGHCLRAQALDVCRQVGASDHPARAASLTTVAQLVAAGLGVTLLPATAVGVETRKGRLGTARFASPVPGRRIGVVHRVGADHTGELAAIAETLRTALRVPGARAA